MLIPVAEDTAATTSPSAWKTSHVLGAFLTQPREREIAGWSERRLAYRGVLTMALLRDFVVVRVSLAPWSCKRGSHVVGAVQHARPHAHQQPCAL